MGLKPGTRPSIGAQTQTNKHKMLYEFTHNAMRFTEGMKHTGTRCKGQLLKDVMITKLAPRNDYLGQ